MIGKSIRPACPENCLFQCRQKVTQLQRQQLFDEFHALADVHAQWQYMARNLTRIVPKYRKISSKDVSRKYNIAYAFVIDGVKVRVCKIYFHNTLGITSSVSKTALKKCDENGVLLEPDMRGFHNRIQPSVS